MDTNWSYFHRPLANQGGHLRSFEKLDARQSANQVGQQVDSDEPLVELETDKVNIEVPSPLSGTLSSIKVKEGDTVAVGALLGTVNGGKSSTTETITLANANTLTLTTGYANPELQPDSGNIVYLENRKPIQRDSDQTEDIKLIIEF